MRVAVCKTRLKKIPQTKNEHSFSFLLEQTSGLLYPHSKNEHSFPWF